MALILFNELSNSALGDFALETFITQAVSQGYEGARWVIKDDAGRRIEYALRDTGGMVLVTGITFKAPDPLAGGVDTVVASISGMFEPLDTMIGTMNLAKLDALRGADSIVGSGGNDQLTGYGIGSGTGTDTLQGNGGDDVLWSRQSGTVLDGGTGNDTIRIENSVGGPYLGNVQGGDGFDTLAIAGQGTYGFAALAGIERLVFTAANAGLGKIVQLKADQVARLSGTLAVESAIGNASIQIGRTTGAAADLDLSGWTFTGWNPSASSKIGVEITLQDNTSGSSDDHVIGTAVNDSIISMGGSDTLDGGAGNDLLVAGAGADTVYGGTGNDTIRIQAGDVGDGELVDGGVGTDTLECDGDVDLLSASISNIERIVIKNGTSLKFNSSIGPNVTFVHESGAATLVQVQVNGKDTNMGSWSFQGWTSQDRLEVLGTAGADWFALSQVKATVSGGDGLDVVTIDRSQTATALTLDFSAALAEYTLQDGSVLRGIEVFNVLGGSGNDNLAGGLYADTLTGGAGRDILAGGGDADILKGGSGSDIIDGGEGDDWLDGGADADIIDGGAGNDTYVVSGSDIIIDSGGFDTVLVSDSFSLVAFEQIENLAVQIAGRADTIDLTGNALANTLSGNAGANGLSGLDGNDLLQGFGGQDRLVGGFGNDTLSGGEGRDVFDFNTKPNASFNMDTILDFSAVDDTIRIDDAVFRGVKRGTLSKKAFVLGKKAADAQDRIIYDKGTGSLYYDPDGTGSTKQVLFAKLANKAAISHLDFVVI